MDRSDDKKICLQEREAHFPTEKMHLFERDKERESSFGGDKEGIKPS